MAEKWRELYTEEQIKKIQKIELQNLLILDNVCKRLGVQYFLYGGTLIGAVRHKGFIPWDDDLDVAMPREDYMKFVKEAPSILPEEYYLQSPYTDTHTPFLYTKLRLKGTKYADFHTHKLKTELGIYIDIYPIDNLPDNDTDYIADYTEYIRTAKRYVLRQNPYPSVQGGSLKRKLRNIARFVISTCMKIIPQSYYVKKADAIMTKYNELSTQRKGNLFYPEPKNIFYNLYPLEEGVFEGFPVKLPGEWDKHLTSRYGNYMELPPEEERLGHVPYLLDFGKY